MKKYDFTFGIPCSFIDHVSDVPCTREDEAMALAVGAYLGGKKALVFMQNSGLGNCVDIITSLLKPYGIHIDIVISHRFQPEQHAFMGKITNDLLKLLEYETYICH